MKNSPPDKKSPRKKPKSFRLSYSAGLLLLMIVIGGASGLIAYRFGQQALEGVTATPAGVKLPRPSTATSPATTKEKDKDTPKPKSDKVSENSFWMIQESEVIAESQQLMRDGLAGITVPVRLPEKPQRRQRRELVADSLALSRNLDGRVSDRNVSERIAELRAELWQRSSLYPSLRTVDSRQNPSSESQTNGGGGIDSSIYSRIVEPSTNRRAYSMSQNSAQTAPAPSDMNSQDSRNLYPKPSREVGNSHGSNSYFLLSAPSNSVLPTTDRASFIIPLSDTPTRISPR